MEPFEKLGTRAGRRAEALRLAKEALALYRELADGNREAYLVDLARSLGRLGGRLYEMRRPAEALNVAEEALALYRELAASNREVFLPDVARGLGDVGVMLSAMGRKAEALERKEEALRLDRELVASNRNAHLPTLGRTLHNIADDLWQAGRHSEALSNAEESHALWLELVATDREAFLPGLADSLDGLGVILGELDRCPEALHIVNEGLALRQELVGLNREAFLPGLASSLNNLSSRLAEMGRTDEALNVAESAVAHMRELVADDREAFLQDLARVLSSQGAALAAVGRGVEALEKTEEAHGLWRELVARDGGAFLPELAKFLDTRGIALSSAGRSVEALQSTQEALDMYRRLTARNRAAYLPDFARTLDNLAIMLVSVGYRIEALEKAEEAAEVYRELAARNRGTFLPDLARSLSVLCSALHLARRPGEVLMPMRECASAILELAPHSPRKWASLCRSSLALDAPRDLRDWFVPLLVVLTSHRELAWNSEHADIFLGLQAEVAARAWELLSTLPAEEGDLLDEAVAALVATLHSPDLARWLDARGSGEGPLARFADLKREVIEAEQLLDALRKRLPGGGDAGWRDRRSGPGIEAQRTALLADIERQSANALALRQAFRDERARLVAEDPRFAAAFEPLRPTALRSIAGQAGGGALLCVLEFGAYGQPERASAGGGRTVAALVHADGRRTQLLELAGVSELAWHADRYVPESGGRRRGPLRGAPASVVQVSAPDQVVEGGMPTVTELLAQRMSRSFWAPLQQALQESGVDVDRLHVCLHRTTQQLPLALRQDDDCAGVQVVPWPGLPYLRRAAMAAAGAGANAAGETSSPWLVGHDCAWGSEQPLPMVAVEAALLRGLLQRHGQPVQAIQRAAQLRGQPSALVACCHGGAEQAQFDHALHLGAEPLTVRQIVQDNIGPPLALLPACHAGRTDEDAAGNALGVAAAFMLSGTKVVSASSKAVPDLLQPWLSTLTVWHAMQGLPHHEAANLAREQFARLEFPEAYRSWLQEALPQALATIQPGGEEDPHIRGPHAHLALETVAAHWPWEGDAEHLFHAERARRDKATRSVVEGILRPRGGEEGARALAAEAREMAAFVFVYGVDRQAQASSACR